MPVDDSVGDGTRRCCARPAARARVWLRVRFCRCSASASSPRACLAWPGIVVGGNRREAGARSRRAREARAPRARGGAAAACIGCSGCRSSRGPSARYGCTHGAPRVQGRKPAQRTAAVNMSYGRSCARSSATSASACPSRARAKGARTSRSPACFGTTGFIETLRRTAALLAGDRALRNRHRAAHVPHLRKPPSRPAAARALHCDEPAEPEALA